MIKFAKKAEGQPLPGDSEENRFDQVRKAAVERHKKSDTDGTRRRDRQTVDDNRLV